MLNFNLSFNFQILNIKISKLQEVTFILTITWNRYKSLAEKES